MIHPHLHHLLARARDEETRRSSAAPTLALDVGGTPSARRRPELPEPRRRSPIGSVTLRYAFPDDHASLVQLAALDDAAPLSEPVLLAEVAGELRAALSLADGRLLSDPFHFSGELSALLHTRAGQLCRAERGRRGWRGRLTVRLRVLAGS